MKDSSGRNGLSRRNFTKGAAVGAAGLTVGLTVASAAEEKAAPADEASQPKIPLRDLGKTGLKVSEISLGAMQVTDPAVIEKAIDEGCTYIDTAIGYQGGNNEKTVGKVMAKRRDEVVLATKFGGGSKEDILKSVETSLASLETDHIDVIQYHGARNAAQVKSPQVKEAFDTLKQQGKVRFLGFTTHSNQAEVINACIETGYVDSMLVGYSAGTPELSDTLKKAREAGIGIVIMKSLNAAGKIKNPGSSMTPHQLAIRWVLDQPFIDTVNVGMNSFAEVETDAKASAMKMSALDRMHLQRFAAACAGDMCGRCGACLACPQGIEPAEIVRAHMYAYSYGNVEMAKAEFLAMDGPARLASCTDCGRCEAACPRSLDIRRRFREVASLVV